MAQFAGNLEKLNQFLADKSYCEGYTPSQADVAAFATIGNNVETARYPHVVRWQSHIASFSPAQRSKWGGKAPVVAAPEEAKQDKNAAAKPEAKPEAKPAAAAAAAADDSESDFNLSDDDDDEETKKMLAEKAAATRAVQARQQAKAEKGTAKSDIAFDVKLLESSENEEENKIAMEDLLKKVRSVEMDGLKWMGYQFVPVGYGILKLRVMCQIIDIKVPGGPDEVIEAISNQDWFEDLVQSVDVFSFQMAA
jgi:elongation factor 1-beta